MPKFVAKDGCAKSWLKKQYTEILRQAAGNTRTGSLRKAVVLRHAQCAEEILKATRRAKTTCMFLRVPCYETYYYTYPKQPVLANHQGADSLSAL